MNKKFIGIVLAKKNSQRLKKKKFNKNKSKISYRVPFDSTE